MRRGKYDSGHILGFREDNGKETPFSWIHSAEELTKLGSKQAVFRLKEMYPNTCVVILYHLEAAIRGIGIKELDDTCKAELKACFMRL